MHSDVVGFAEVTGDRNPIHLSEHFAAKTPFGTRIAHGLYTASLISAVLGTRLPGPGAIYISQTLNFRAPVKIGDTVEVRVSVAELMPEKFRARLACTCSVDGRDGARRRGLGEGAVEAGRRPAAAAHLTATAAPAERSKRYCVRSKRARKLHGNCIHGNKHWRGCHAEQAADQAPRQGHPCARNRSSRSTGWRCGHIFDWFALCGRFRCGTALCCSPSIAFFTSVDTAAPPSFYGGAAALIALLCIRPPAHARLCARRQFAIAQLPGGGAKKQRGVPSGRLQRQ